MLPLPSLKYFIKRCSYLSFSWLGAGESVQILATLQFGTLCLLSLSEGDRCWCWLLTWKAPGSAGKDLWAWLWGIIWITSGGKTHLDCGGGHLLDNGSQATQEEEEVLAAQASVAALTGRNKIIASASWCLDYPAVEDCHSKLWAKINSLSLLSEDLIKAAGQETETVTSGHFLLQMSQIQEFGKVWGVSTNCNSNKKIHNNNSNNNKK